MDRISLLALATACGSLAAGWYLWGGEFVFRHAACLVLPVAVILYPEMVWSIRFQDRRGLLKWGGDREAVVGDLPLGIYRATAWLLLLVVVACHHYRCHCCGSIRLRSF